MQSLLADVEDQSDLMQWLIGLVDEELQFLDYPTEFM